MDGPRLPHVDSVRAAVVEQPLPGAEEERRDVDLELVEQAGAEVLLRDAGAPGQQDVAVARRGAGAPRARVRAHR